MQSTLLTVVRFPPAPALLGVDTGHRAESVATYAWLFLPKAVSGRGWLGRLHVDAVVPHEAKALSGLIVPPRVPSFSRV